MTMVFSSAEQLVAAEGQDLGTTDWVALDQGRIDQFADATDDHQWIHVDPVRAKDGPFGACIAHGYLTLALANLFLSAITVLELELGVLRIEHRDSVQGAILRAWLEEQVLPAFSGRILPVDTAVARRCAKLRVPDPCSERDALIAATALTHGLIVATRNGADFQPTGVETLNPWTFDIPLA